MSGPAALSGATRHGRLARMRRPRPSSVPAGETRGDAPASTQIEALVSRVGAAVIGDRVRRVRTSMGLSIRDVATQSGLSKTSVVRLEQGGASRAATLVRVCDVLGLHVDGLSAAGAGEEVMAVHRAGDDRWYDLGDVAGAPLPAGDAPHTGEVGRDAVDVAVDLLRSRLPRGRVLPTILEVHRQSAVRSHPGEEFVYVLAGRLRLSVGASVVVLTEGESVCFLSGEPHSYAPAGRGPARVLSVRVNGPLSDGHRAVSEPQAGSGRG